MGSRRLHRKDECDRDVLELCIRNTRDMRNDREDNSPRSFRKAAYRQFILARHGHLGKGNRRVCPSCCVLKIRGHFPSVTGVYMGFRKQTEPLFSRSGCHKKKTSTAMRFKSLTFYDTPNLTNALRKQSRCSSDIQPQISRLSRP